MVINVSGGGIEPHSKIEHRRMTDNEARNTLERLHIGATDALLTMPREQRKALIRKAIGSGISMRQLARITGIDYRTIYRVINPNIDKNR